MENRITPDFITSLKENEIFVFGCRRSGRHWEGAAAFALENFGALRRRTTRTIIRNSNCWGRIDRCESSC